MPTLKEMQAMAGDLDYRPVSLAELKGEVEEPGFIQSIAQSIASPFLRAGVTGAQAVVGTKQLISGDTEGLKRTFSGRPTDFGYFGKVKPIETTKEAFGVGLEAASNLPVLRGASQLGKATLKGLVKEGVKRGVIEGGIGGLLFGTGSALEKDGGFVDVAKEGAFGGIVGATFGGVLGGTLPIAGNTTRRAFRAVKKRVGPDDIRINTALDDAINKGIKPYFAKTTTPEARDVYTKKAKQAFQIIDRLDTKFEDEAGELISRNPTNRMEMLDGLNQAKRAIYSAYHNLAQQAGEKGAQFNAAKPAVKLSEISKDISYSPSVRKYAEDLITEILELEGQSPEIIEKRIAEYNSSLAGYFAGRVDKARARIDASIANLLREELDSLIERETEKVGYQALKNQYSALKTVERDLARQVAIEARRGTKGFLDFTDIFTGQDLLQGVLTVDPTAIVRGATGRGIKEYYKWLNDPNRYIKNAFEVLENVRKNPRTIIPTKPPLSFPITDKVKNSIVNKIYQAGSWVGKSGGKDVFGGPVEKGRKMYLVIGPPAAGKSEVLANPLSRKNKALLIDADRVAAEHPNYQGGLNRAGVQGDSSDIAEGYLLTKAINEGANIVMPLVGKTQSKLENIAKLARKSGYDVKLILNHVKPETAVERAQARARKTGRETPADYILKEVGNKPLETFKNLRKSSLFSEKTAYSNEVPYGKSLKVLDTSDGSFVFSSPNTKTGLQYDDAFTALKSDEHKQAIKRYQQIDKEMDIPVGTHSAIGKWSDGAENTSYYIDGDLSVEELRLNAARKGIGDGTPQNAQKQVIWFKGGEGSDYIHEIKFHGVDPKKVSELASELGIQYQTIGSDRLIIFNKSGDFFDKDMVKKIRGLHTKLNKNIDSVDTITGRGEFEGSWLEDDMAARQEAVGIYNSIISNSGK
jgi:predicted ABC-type ATPase